MSDGHDVLVRRILSCLDSHPAASAEVIARQLGVHRPHGNTMHGSQRQSRHPRVLVLRRTNCSISAFDFVRRHDKGQDAGERFSS
jgi:hypothetical protein